jgi:hypothetical protein
MIVRTEEKRRVMLSDPDLQDGAAGESKLHEVADTPTLEAI